MYMWTNTRGGGVYYELNDYITHPTDDIGILITKERIRFSNRVGPACLPFNINKMDLEGLYVTAADNNDEDVEEIREAEEHRDEDEEEVREIEDERVEEKKEMKETKGERVAAVEEMIESEDDNAEDVKKMREAE
ncbi:hypothetical protein O3M35_011663 [Rhynocoris fuscipes]|uniref:Uncharacterized protein n=1 Tax=Rhynocoris fuscipes TaxID=488301 RepID=A0AAW1D1L7_9HEMI